MIKAFKLYLFGLLSLNSPLGSFISTTDSSTPNFFTSSKQIMDKHINAPVPIKIELKYFEI